MLKILRGDAKPPKVATPTPDKAIDLARNMALVKMIKQSVLLILQSYLEFYSFWKSDKTARLKSRKCKSLPN